MKKKLFGMLASAMLLFPLFGGAITASATELDHQQTNCELEEPEEGYVNVTLHKRVFANMPDATPNTGEVMDFGGDPLDGVEFTVYDVTDQYYLYINGSTEAPGMTAKQALERIQTDAAAAGNRAPAYAVFEDKGTTCSRVNGAAKEHPGTVVFELAEKNVQGKDKVYLFIETNAPATITQMAVPIVISLPLYSGNNPDELLSDIHLYPKNEQKENTKKLTNANLFDTVTIGEDTYYDVATNDRLDYAITIHVPAAIGEKASFIVTDRPDAGLEFVTGSLAIDGLTEGTDYVLDETAPGFTVTFDTTSSAILGLAGQPLQINYTMTVTAEVLDQGLTNTAEIQFGTETDEVTSDKVGTGGHKFQKINAHDKTGLAAAEFVVKNGDESAVFEVVNGEYVFVDWTAAEGTKITSGADGTFAIKGLQTGTYILEETKAPAGFIILDKETSFTIVAGGYSDITQLETVENTPKGILPETGGKGIMLFLAIGAALMAGAFIWYKRAQANTAV